MDLSSLVIACALAGVFLECLFAIARKFGFADRGSPAIGTSFVAVFVLGAAQLARQFVNAHLVFEQAQLLLVQFLWPRIPDRRTAKLL